MNTERNDSSPDLEEAEGWHGYRRHVLGSLNDLKETDKNQSKDLQDIKTSIAILSTKVTIYAAGVALLVSALVEFAARMMGK
jgi:hypothetical protein